MRVLIRGAGDIATGIALRLYRSHMQVVMTDLPAPTAIRRTVCFSQAIVLGRTEVEGVAAVLAADAAEAEILTGLTDRAEAAKLLHSWGAKEVLITHNTEVLAYDGNKVYTCPIKARNLSGRTGRGDTTFAGYISERQRAGVEEALRYCTALVSLKMETPGPFQGTRQDVLDYIREFY